MQLSPVNVRKHGLLKFRCGLAVIITAILVTGCHKTPDEIKLADYLIARHLTTPSDSAVIRPLVDTLLAGTKWQSLFQINKSYDPGKVNIFIISGNSSAIESDPVTADLIGNGLFVGYNIIFLDGDYLRSFLEKHHIRPDYHNYALMDDQPSFLCWIVGHELGHLICGHLHGHFDAGQLDKFVKTSSLDNKEELQADSVFVHQTISHKMMRISEQRLAMNMLNCEIEQKVGKIQTMGVGLIYDYTNKQIVTYARQPTHPEYVVRLSRMLELSAKASRDTGLYNLIGGFTKQLRQVQ